MSRKKMEGVSMEKNDCVNIEFFFKKSDSEIVVTHYFYFPKVKSLKFLDFFSASLKSSHLQMTDNGRQFCKKIIKSYDDII